MPNGFKKGNTIALAHGHTSGPKHTPEYKAWDNMKQRCLNPNMRETFKNYGGRGITVCAEWLHDFAAFLAHVGPHPGPGYSIDRIDVNGNYEPGNVRWATRSEQNRNRRQPRISTGANT
jgi:hypothetical protein